MHPEVLWAQRSSEWDEKKNVLYLTVNLTEIIESSVEYNLTATSLSFKAKAGHANPQEYSFSLDLFAEVLAEESTKRLTSRAFTAVLLKKEKKAEFWPRLTKDKAKAPYIKTDFSKWVDEDEQDGEPTKAFDEEEGAFDGGSMDFQNMMSQVGASAGGGGGFPSHIPDADSSDDEMDDGPPPLEDAEAPKAE